MQVIPLIMNWNIKKNMQYYDSCGFIMAKRRKAALNDMI